MTTGAAQRSRYAERVERAAAHMEQCLAEGRAPKMADLARAAAMSEFHFQRVYRLMTGETAGETIRRLRIARGLTHLSRPAAVTEAAGASAYATSQAFARAFRKQTGRSPSEARGEAAGALAHELSRSGQSSEAAMSVEVVEVEPFRIAAIRNVGAYAELNQAYERLFGLVLAERAPDEIAGIYGVPLDDDRYTEPGECRFECGLRIEGEDAPSGTRWLDAGGGRHARLRHVGSYDELQEAYDELYAHALAMPGTELRDAPLIVHYIDDPESRPEGELRSDIFLPLV
jgi:AraC family transcriptional regulator